MDRDEARPTYPGGITGLLQQMEGRRDPLTFAPGETLPAVDADLREYTAALVPSSREDPLRAISVASSNRRKFLELRSELEGHSELTVLHGLLVAHLRKRSQPPECWPLFERLWAEEADHLLVQLNPRWQVSAVTTFGDHGRTPVQRQVGAALSVLFGTMKLYETERRYSGQSADKPFALSRLKTAPLPMEMDPFSLANGGLDVNMLGRLWQDAEQDPVIQPLAHALLDRVIHDPRTVFRRLRTMRQRRAKKQAQTHDAETKATASYEKVIVPVPHLATPSKSLRWGVVCTTNADAHDIIAWVAHYITLGVDHLYLFFDAPNPTAQAFFASDPRVTTTLCDDAFWSGRGKPRPDAHQLRQAHNATQALHQTSLDFLAHFDIDEFLISPQPVADALRACPPDAAFARVRPAELLTPLAGPPRHFKRAHKELGHPKSVLETLYPTFGPYLAGGLISHTSGKIFARTGLSDTRLGIHGLKFRGAHAQNRAELPNMVLGHQHCKNVTQFLERRAFRLRHGSYRKAEGADASLKLADVLDFLEREEGEDGLRGFYKEVCTARTELLTGLTAHNMLVTHDLDLSTKVAQVFGDRARGAA